MTRTTGHAARTLSILVLGLALAILLAGCGGTANKPASKTPAATGGNTTVVEKNIAFNPTSVTVKVGDTVTFSNEDSMTHHVDVNGQDLGEQAPGKSVTWTATKTGTFPFRCLIHPSMTGEITVK